MVKRVLGGLSVAAILMSSSAAVAGEATRAASALPAAKSVSTDSLKGVRSARTTSNENKQTGAGIGIAVAAAVAVGLGIYAAVDNDDDDPDFADSPGG